MYLTVSLILRWNSKNLPINFNKIHACCCWCYCCGLAVCQIHSHLVNCFGLKFLFINVCSIFRIHTHTHKLCTQMHICMRVCVFLLAMLKFSRICEYELFHTAFLKPTECIGLCDLLLEYFIVAVVVIFHLFWVCFYLPLDGFYYCFWFLKCNGCWFDSFTILLTIICQIFSRISDNIAFFLVKSWVIHKSLSQYYCACRP